MKSKLKNVFRIILLTFTIVLMHSINVSAATSAQASIGKKSYSTVQKALASVKNGQTIKIQKDIIITDSIRMKRNVKFTLDLNKHTVKKIQHGGDLMNPRMGDFDLAKGQMNVKNGTLDAWVTVQKGATLNVKKGTYSRIENWGTVNVTDGIIKGRTDVGEYFQRDAYALVNYGKMTISGGKVEATVLNFKGKTTLNKEGLISYDCADIAWGIRVYGGNVVVAGGKIETKFAGGYNADDQRSLIFCEQGKVEIKGGILDSEEIGGIYSIYNAEGKVIVSKGKIIGYNVIFNRGKFIVNGGNIMGYIYNDSYMEVNGGTLSSASEVLRCGRGSSTYISNGTFISEQGSPFFLSPYEEPKIFSVSQARVINKSSISGYVFYRKLNCMKLIEENITFVGFDALINPYTI